MSNKKVEKTTVCEAAITNLAFGPGFKQIVFVPNNHQIHIADVPVSLMSDCTKWNIVATLEEHAQLVSGLSWGHKTNKILSCAHDRTAFVWSQDDKTKTWTPVHILLDAAVKRGLTGCSWNPAEDRAMIGSAAFNVAVGKDDAPNPFWSCVVLQPHTSTVTCIAAHPTIERTVATGSSDCSVKITVTKGRAPEPKVTLKTKGWVLDLQWSPSGNALAYCTQSCHVWVATGDVEDWSTFTAKCVRLPSLPLRSIAWLGDVGIVGGGYDNYPIALAPKKEGDLAGEWIVEGKFAGQPKTLHKEKSVAQLAKEKFQNEASYGQQQSIDLPETKHTNTISKVVTLPQGTEEFEEYAFASASMDGRIEFWKLEEMQA